jgi:soluble lytic murein transglycosylase-like protein
MKKLISIGIILCIGFLLGWGIRGKKVEYIYIYVKPAQTEPSIEDPKLIQAIIRVESNHKVKATSKKGAIGLMQIRYCVWHKELKQIGIHSRKDLFVAHKNIRAGKYILASYHKGDLRETLRKYSGGQPGYYESVMYHYFMGE